MDKVRFGRAIGRGVRASAKSLMEAADAAASPDPRPAARAKPVVEKVAEVHRHVAETRSYAKRAVVSGGKQAAKGMAAPLRKFSSVLWLEVTGTFFAFIAFFIAQGAWKLRASWQSGPDHARFLLHVGLCALFAYFAVTSFLRARKRDRRG